VAEETRGLDAEHDATGTAVGGGEGECVGEAEVEEEAGARE
jgi:hypothetical protein